ncbi:hypothetical protein [Marinobacter adhaerens]|jgi:DNA-binding GntR family transcriptional regulator|uniref:hypothetical protein n=1 Tax=Marinobacter adhaerens TaxID=1033846 RepID=UPI001E30587B|nr:hypothetical protein [Marinobacter adhaerens]MCD1646042.1 hypothetical protein [Marinobacter adhaerens]
MSAQPQVKELIGYSFLIGFANDHVFDARELITLEALAGSHGRVDEAEILALRALLDRLEEQELAMSVRLEVDQFRETNNI